MFGFIQITIRSATIQLTQTTATKPYTYFRFRPSLFVI